MNNLKFYFHSERSEESLPFTDVRHSRQILLPEIGVAGQTRLAGSSVLVVGAGGLGAPVLMYLTAAGVGRIGIIDGDAVSESNLNRQVLYGTGDVGAPKALRAAERLRLIDPVAEITAFSEALTENNAVARIKGYDALVLCLDSTEARHVANRACVGAGIPYVDAGVHGFTGTLTTVIPGKTACYACIHTPSSIPAPARAPAPTSESAPASTPAPAPVPVLGAMAGWIGCAEALAAVRLLLGVPDPSMGALLFFDGAEMSVDRITLERDPGCAVCGKIFI